MNHGRDRQTVFFTAVNPMNKKWIDKGEQDLTKPRLAACKQAWKISPDAVFWVDVCRAQRMGLNNLPNEVRMRPLNDTLPPICIERVVSRKTEEDLFLPKLQSRHVLLRRLPSKLIGKKIGILVRQQAAAAPNQSNQTS